MRCIICDYCPETSLYGGFVRPMTYSRKDNGYICNHCSTAIGDALAEFGDEEETELERVELLEDEDLDLHT